GGDGRGHGGADDHGGERRASSGERQLHDGRGHGADGGGAGSAGQRHGRGQRDADGGAGGRAEPRHADAERQRVVHVHPGGQLQRQRQLHLPGVGRQTGSARCRGSAEDHGGEGRVGGGVRQSHDG